MLNHVTKALTTMGSAFAFAALTGCSTMSTPTLNEESCMVGHEVKNELFLAFYFKANSPQEYSTSCNAGRVAAQTTYIGRDAQGNLNPTAAVFALQFYQDVQENIKSAQETGDKRTAAYYQQIKNYFELYLRKMGGMDIKQIQDYVDQLAAKQNQPSKFIPNCTTGSSIIRSCAASPKEPVVQ